MDNDNSNRQVIHLFLKGTGEHYYFGSIAAMYSHFSSQQLGVAAQSLYNRWKDQKTWENENIILRKGRLINKKNKN